MSKNIPDSWHLSTLGELAAIKGGKRLPKGESFSEHDTDFPYIRVSDFENGSVSLQDIRYVTENIRDKIKRYIISSSDLYISIAGTLGLVGEVPALLNGALLTENAAKIVFKNHSESSKPYFKYYLSANDAQAHFHQAKGTGGGVPKLALFRIEDTPILVPPLPEQKKIATILTSVDTVIEKTQAQIDKLNDLKTGMMQELLTKGIGPDGKPHTEFRDSPVGWIPVGWEFLPLMNYLTYISYGFTNPMPETESGPFMITAKDVKGLEIQYGNARHTAIAAFKDLLTDKSRPEINDILLTKDGTLGRVAIVDKSGICINQSVAVLRPKENILPKYLLYLLASPMYQQVMLDNAGGSTIKHIYITVVDKMPVGVPEIDEQQRIVDNIDSMMNRSSLANRKLSHLKSIKKALMSDLLTGKVRVTPDD